MAPASIARALALVDTWLEAWAARDYPLETAVGHAPRVQVLGCWFMVRVFERAQIVRAPTPAQLAAVKRRNPYRTGVPVYQPTGRLHLARDGDCALRLRR